MQPAPNLTGGQSAFSRREQAFRIRVGGDELAPRQARREVAKLGSELERSMLDTTQLLVTEVVTNSVRHAGADAVELAVSLDPRRVRVEVSNPGAPFEPRSREEAEEPNPGWGLFLVDELSDAWGVDGDSAGQRVWFEISRD
jgi:anti-sigma regulatory factor (Ser/Thr protein kinase)